MNTPQQEITHRRVLGIALPIVLSNATVPILGAVDTGVVGQLGEAAPIGAVGLGAIILSTIYWIFGFLRMGTTGLVAQAVGQDDKAEISALLSRALMVGVIGGVLIIFAQLPLYWGAFKLSPASDQVESLARDYMSIRIWSAPAAIALYGLIGWLIAQERTAAVLVLQLWMNGLNIVLDLWFVLGLGWGVEGVAIATFLAEWTGAAFGLWFCRSAFLGSDWRDRARLFDSARWRELVLLNTDILIRSLLLEAIFVSFLFIGASFGDVRLAANQVLLQFIMIVSFAVDGFAFAAEALVGKAYGAKKPALIRRATIVTAIWGIIISVLLGIAFAIWGEAVIELMTTSKTVRQMAVIFLPYLIFAPPFACAAFLLDGVFVGAMRSRDMRDMMIVSFLVYAAVAAALVPTLGNHGLWLAFLISFVARGITLALRYPELERSAA